MSTVLDQQGNLDTVNHAESTLARRAFERFEPDYLWQCTLVTTVEPCAMCSGTQYWAHIGRLVYGLSERQLLDLTGNHEQNPTMNLSSREVFKAGQKPIEVIGPVRELQDELVQLHLGFWSRN
jgi:tRNA(Arg) A34 adenosine deaminase TadA